MTPTTIAVSDLMFIGQDDDVHVGRDDAGSKLSTLQYSRSTCVLLFVAKVTGTHTLNQVNTQIKYY